MPLFGAHMSIAGGVGNAVTSALRYGCDTLQIFTKNASQWAAPPLSNETVSDFRNALSDSGLRFATAHDSYLINLASPDEELYQRSVAAFAVELQRADALGLTYLVMHPGAHVGSGDEAGLTRVAAGLDAVHAACPTERTQVLLETTAGQGTTLGHRFEHLAAILERVAQPERLGVCLDTCHVFAAGYPLWPEADYRATFQEFDRVVGLARVRVFHVNDSVRGLGSRVDRHASLGEGAIGLEAFRLLVNDPRFAGHPFILETPKGDAANDLDVVNLALLRGLVK